MPDPEIAKTTRYWKESLVQAGRLLITPERLKPAVHVPASEIWAGRLNEKVTRGLLPKAGPNVRKVGGPQASTSPRVASVLLGPVHFRSLPSQGRHPSTWAKDVVPLVIPATLDEEGRLTPEADAPPYVPRDLLAPLAWASRALAEVDEVDQFFATHEVPAPEQGWEALWQFGAALLKVCGINADDLALVGYELHPEGAVVIPSERNPTAPSERIIQAYEMLLEQNTYPALYSNYANPGERAAQTPSHKLPGAQFHLGQMTNAYPLFPSQRLALHHLLQAEDGEILAVNGPPGTGKTTLVQSIVAHAFVQAAVRGTDPPLIVVGSSNNQAVTNVLASFEKAVEVALPDPFQHLSGRWIPELSSYGVYGHSPPRADGKRRPMAEFDRYLKTTYRGEGFFSRWENKDSHTGAQQFYLEKCTAYFGRKIETVDEAVQLLQARLVETTEALMAVEGLGVARAEHHQKLMAEHGGPAGLEAAIQAAAAALGDHREETQRTHEEHRAWLAHEASRPWTRRLLTALFSRWTPVGRLLCRDTQAYLSFRGVESWFKDFDADAVESTFKARGQGLATLVQTEEAVLGVLREERRVWLDLDGRCQEFKTHWGVEPGSGEMEAQLDTGIRFRAFKLATHYWEGRWLEHLWQSLHRDGPRRQEWKVSASRLKEQWRGHAMLTPCMVLTFFMLPKFFTGEEPHKPLYGLIDLLIVDEAGQVPPEVAGVAFSFAKKAAVIGDLLQLEPYWGHPRKVDGGNLLRNGLLAEGLQDLDQAEAAGFTVSRGSALRVAQRRCRWLAAEPRAKGTPFERGMLLREHRRCHKEIIRYCNDYVYEGLLIPLREEEQTQQGQVLPPLGWANVEGKESAVRGSRRNEYEASTVANWILDNRSVLLERYPGFGIEKIVAVVTPFAQQAVCIEEHLMRASLGGLTVGTAHRLQGAERPVVLFSPVYTDVQGGEYFFDRGPNLLNVAVSRARDSFLVIGCMRVFQEDFRTPSGNLAKLLFADPANELVEVKLPPRQQGAADSHFRHLTTLDDHRNTLHAALNKAVRRVVIASPFLSASAVSADNLLDYVERASRRGVEITVYTDQQLNQTDGQEKKSARGAIEALERAGAQVRTVRGIHAKTLCRDTDLLVEGSFNWLSAERRSGHAWQRYEASIAYEGPHAQEMVTRSISNLAAKAHSPSTDKRFA